MNNARLLAVSIERFKSFKQPTRIELAPLTIILGRNNSGKSTIIQSLLLLKQTLGDPRPDVRLKLEGVVEAFNLRELTFGWPAASDPFAGPAITLEWDSEVDVRAALKLARGPDLTNLAKHSGVEWLGAPPEPRVLTSSLRLHTTEVGGVAQVSEITLRSLESTSPGELRATLSPEGWACSWNGQAATKIAVELDHFIPYLRIDRRGSGLGPRDKQRAWHNAYLVLFAQPLEALKKLLAEMHYLGSSRQPPPSLYKPATTAPSEIGVSGELAAQLLHRRQQDLVHFLPPVPLEGGTLPEMVWARPLAEAVNDVMKALTIESPLRVEEIQEVGFRLMFGEASLMHVGRGLNSLLPLVELGLFADPLRFTGAREDTTLATYREHCGAFAHIALEEPEAHLHPKVASRLAHWLVSLALSNRRLLVETHSDHLVRRLRGLAARAGRGSALERWLLENVVVLSVEQDQEGCSTVTTSRLTAEGGVAETWPTDFMDEASDEESAIYYAKLDKADTGDASAVEFIDGPEPEPDEAP